MIYIIYKMLPFLKNHQNYLKDSFFECFSKEYNRLLFFLEGWYFSQHIMIQSFSPEEEK